MTQRTPFYSVPPLLPSPAVHFIEPLQDFAVDSTFELIAPSEKRGTNVRSHYWKMLPDEEKNAEKRRRKEKTPEEGVVAQLRQNPAALKRYEKLPPSLQQRLNSLYEKNPTMFAGSILDSTTVDAYDVGQDFDPDDIVEWDDDESTSHSSNNCTVALSGGEAITEERLLSLVGIKPIVILRSYGACRKRWEHGLDNCPEFFPAEDDNWRCDTCGCHRCFHEITDKTEDGRIVESIPLEGLNNNSTPLLSKLSSTETLPMQKRRGRKRKSDTQNRGTKKRGRKPKRQAKGDEELTTTVESESGPRRKRLVQRDEISQALSPTQEALLEELARLLGHRHCKSILYKVRDVLIKLAKGELLLDGDDPATELDGWMDSCLKDSAIFSDSEEAEGTLISKRTRTRITQCIQKLCDANHISADIEHSETEAPSSFVLENNAEASRPEEQDIDADTRREECGESLIKTEIMLAANSAIPISHPMYRRVKIEVKQEPPKPKRGRGRPRRVDSVANVSREPVCEVADYLLKCAKECGKSIHISCVSLGDISAHGWCCGEC